MTVVEAYDGGDSAQYAGGCNVQTAAPMQSLRDSVCRRLRRVQPED
jgi:hypothetical protein